MKRRPGSSGGGAAGQRNLRGTQHTVGAIACSRRFVAPHSPPPRRKLFGPSMPSGQGGRFGTQKKSNRAHFLQRKNIHGGFQILHFSPIHCGLGKKNPNFPGKKNDQTRVRNKNNSIEVGIRFWWGIGGSQLPALGFKRCHAGGIGHPSHAWGPNGSTAGK